MVEMQEFIVQYKFSWGEETGNIRSKAEVSFIDWTNTE